MREEEHETTSRADAPTPGPLQWLPVLASSALRCVHGVNAGDPICESDLLVLDDAYRFSGPLNVRPLPLAADGPGATFRVAGGAEGAVPGHAVHLDSAIGLMTETGNVVQAVLLVETDAEGHVEEVWIHALAPLAPETDYRLVSVDPDGAGPLMADLACASFAAGTHITLADGNQVAIEALSPGDRVLTRDAGPREVRWVGRSTVRATGAFAPIVIKAGALNNARDLMLSPAHRLFVYQRSDRLGTGRAELLVQARHLVDGEQVVRAEGGFVDYHQLVLDDHHIVFAEGIAAESLMIDPRTLPALPDAVADSLGGSMDAVAAFEPKARELDRPDVLPLLRAGSAG